MSGKAYQELTAKCTLNDALWKKPDVTFSRQIGDNLRLGQAFRLKTPVL
jgi:hypothetical protein